MRKFIKRFVQEYKDVSLVKKKASFESSLPIGSIIKETLFVLGLIIGFSVLFDLYDNLHFVLLVSKLYLVGSFLLFRVKYELIFKQINRLEYSTAAGIMDDFLKFIIVLFTVHSVLYVFVLFSVVSIVLVIASISIAIVAMLIYLRLINLPKYTVEPFDIREPLRILWLSFLAIGFFYASGIESIILAYVTIIGVFIIMGTVYNAFRTIWRDLYGLRKIFTIILVLGFMGTTFSVYDNREVEVFNSMIYKKANSMETLEYELPTDIRDLSVEGYDASRDLTLVYSVVDGFLVLELEDEIKWLDGTFNEVKTIQTEENAEYFFIENELYKSVLSDNQSGIEEEDDVNRRKSRYDLYLLNADQSYTYTESVVYRDRLHETRMIDFYWLDNDLYYLERYDGLNGIHFSYLFDTDGKIIEEPMFDENEIVYETDHDFLYTYSNEYDVIFRNAHNSAGAYHDGQIYYYCYLDRNSYIMSTEAFIDKDFDESLNLDWDETMVHPVRSMISGDGRYILLISDDVFDRDDRSVLVFNSEGEKVDSMPDVHDIIAFDGDTLIINKHEEYRRGEYISTFEIHRVPDDELYDNAFKTQVPLIRMHTAFLIMIVVLNTNTLFAFNSIPDKKPH